MAGYDLHEFKRINQAKSMKPLNKNSLVLSALILCCIHFIQKPVTIFISYIVLQYFSVYIIIYYNSDTVSNGTI